MVASTGAIPAIWFERDWSQTCTALSTSSPRAMMIEASEICSRLNVKQSDQGNGGQHDDGDVPRHHGSRSETDDQINDNDHDEDGTNHVAHHLTDLAADVFRLIRHGRDRDVGWKTFGLPPCRPHTPWLHRRCRRCWHPTSSKGQRSRPAAMCRHLRSGRLGVVGPGKPGRCSAPGLSSRQGFSARPDRPCQRQQTPSPPCR